MKKSVFIMILVAGIIFAIANRFIQDDAYISLRYAQNLVNGAGLVFNTGERVEGYTNFLWTILLIIPHVSGISNITFITVFGLCCLVIILLILRKLFNARSDKAFLNNLFLLMLITNYSLSSYVTGGLETILHTSLFVCAIYLVFHVLNKNTSVSYYFGIGVISALIIMNRLDGGLFVTVIYIVILYSLFKNKTRPYSKILGLLLPPLLILLPWFYWKLDFYGSILPNTFNAKISGSTNSYSLFIRGGLYVALFFLIYFFFPSFILLYKKTALTLKFSYFDKVVSTIIIAYLVYYIYVGGDFMEFRFIVPLLPLLIVLMHSLLKGTNIRLLYIFVFLYLCCSVTYMISFKGHLRGFESIVYLSNHISGKDNDWRGIGTRLHDLFPDANVKIAVSPAGAIPYYSQLPTIDMLGLNDENILKNGAPFRDTPGHFRIATPEYLNSKRVNIVIGHPEMVQNKELPRYRNNFYNNREVIKRILPSISELNQKKIFKVIELSINEEYTLVAWYLNQHELIERAAENGLLTIKEI